MAGLRRVARINQNQLHTKLRCFVVEKLAQLIKRPTIRTSSFCFAAGHLVGAFPDSGQVLKSNDLFIVFGISNDAVANDVISVFLKALFLARQPLQQSTNSTPCTACAFRCFLLELCSQITVMISNFCNVFSAKRISIRVKT